MLTRGHGWVSKAIRAFTRRIGEARSKVNHVGIAVFGSSPYWMDSEIVEALSSVKLHTIRSNYEDTANRVWVYRAKNITTDERNILALHALSYVGRTYGYLKLATHFLDWVLQGAYVFRRLTNSDRYPICSWVVAKSYARLGLDFGVDAGQAHPDDIWDFVTSRPDIYECVIDGVVLKGS